MSQSEKFGRWWKEGGIPMSEEESLDIKAACHICHAVLSATKPEIDALKEEIGLCYGTLESRDGNIETIKAEVERLRKDAERYQFLRNPTSDVALVLDKVVGEVPAVEGMGGGGYKLYEYRAGEDLDATIDAAMKETK